jgi:TonB family protein
MKQPWFALVPSTLLVLVFSQDTIAAQETPALSTVIDARNSPPGFLAPKAAEPRDVSMAKYARESFLDGEEGVVGLRLRVRQDGSVSDIQLTQSSGSARLDQAAQDLVKDWRYQPATISGSPVEAMISVEIIWALQTLAFNLTPEHVRRMSAYYPEASVRLRDEGTSTVRFLVSPDGKVANAVLDKTSGNKRLDDAAINMVRTGWSFSPITLASNQSVGGWFRTNIAWRMGQRYRDPGPCGTPPGATDRDATIAACTEFLTRGDLTAYQKALAYRARGIAYRLKREFDPALADFGAALRLSPGIADIFVSRARAHLAKGNRDLAFADFDSAMQVEPLSWQVLAARGVAREETGEIELAVADFNSAVRMAPVQSQATVYNERCFFLGRIGRAQDALMDCDKSLGLRPRDPDTLDTRGYVRLRLNQYQEAMRDYEAVLRIAPKHAPSLYGRGVAKLKLGDRRGEADINAAKEVAPNIAEDMLKLGIAP